MELDFLQNFNPDIAEYIAIILYSTSIALMCGGIMSLKKKSSGLTKTVTIFGIFIAIMISILSFKTLVNINTFKNIHHLIEEIDEGKGVSV